MNLKFYGPEEDVMLDDTGMAIAEAIRELRDAMYDKTPHYGGVATKDVNFYDYDGTVLYAYTAADFLKLKKMPNAPTLDGYEFRGWNWHFDRAQAYVAKYGKLEIGALYAPVNVGRQSKITINIPEGGRTRVSFCWRQEKYQGVKVYFSDAPDSEYKYGGVDGVVVTAHEFPGPGEYTITFDPDDDAGFNFGDGVEINVLACNYTDLQEAMFSNYITEVVIGNTITEISDYAFEKCFKLERVVIPDTVTSIGLHAFEGCLALKSLTIPDSVTSIGQHAFDACHVLQSLIIPDSVTSIEGYAFANCYVLKSLTIPDSVTSIGQNAFYYCYILQSLTIPDTVTSIGQYAFYGVYVLQSLTIPDSVTSIGERAFVGCNVLQSLTIPGFVTSIGQFAFTNCFALQSLIIPDSVMSIEPFTFFSCYALQSLTIPDTVTSIGQQAFAFCFALQSLTLLSETPPTLANTNAFADIPYDCVIYVPYSEDHSILNAYKTASNWSAYADKMVELPAPEVEPDPNAEPTEA